MGREFQETVKAVSILFSTVFAVAVMDVAACFLCRADMLVLIEPTFDIEESLETQQRDLKVEDPMKLKKQENREGIYKSTCLLF